MNHFLPSPPDFQPWATGRRSAWDLIRDCDPSEALGPFPHAVEDRSAPLRVYAQDERLFALVVSPVIDQITAETDVASLLISLLEQVALSPDPVTLTQLYQLLINQDHFAFSVHRAFAQAFVAGPLCHSTAIHHLFLRWARHAPDVEVVDFALFVLTRTAERAPVELLTTLARCVSFSFGAVCALAAQHGPAEDELIALARLHSHGTRSHVLQALVSVDKAEHRQWLLTEGYDNGADYHPSACFAAVHGRWIDVLMQPVLTAGELYHAARLVERLCRNAGDAPFYGHWWTMLDYPDGPVAAARLIEHVAAAGTPEHAWPGMRELLYFLERDDFDPAQDGTAIWSAAVSAPMAARLRGLLTQAHVDPDLLWWDRPAPTIAQLQSGDVSGLNSVLMDAHSPDGMAEVVAWAIGYLSLDAGPQAQALRRDELLGQAMPGVSTGGIAIMTDPALASVYGQVVLQMLQRLTVIFVPTAWPLVALGLDSDISFHRQTAAEALAKWPRDALPAQAHAAVQRAMAAAGDDGDVLLALIESLA